MRYSINKMSQTMSHPDFRWDSEYICFEPLRNDDLKYKTISEVLVGSQYGLSIDMNEEGNGIRIYRMNEIGHMICDRDVLKYAPINSREIKEYRLQDRDVLFNRTNSQEFVGRTGLFRESSDKDYVFASYLIRIKADLDIVTPEYLTAFLNTKYGILDIKRRARISINQSNVNAEELKRIKIPIVSREIQLGITEFFDTAFTLVKLSEKRYQEAQTLLLSELGLIDWQPKHHLSFVKNYSDTEQAGRLDAEHFQPKYDELIEAITTNSFYSKSISEIQTYNARGLQPKYAVDGELDVITSKHILEHDLNYDGFEKTSESNWKTQKKARVKKGDILTYTTGANIGRTACYSISKPALASNHVNILRIRNENPEYVAFVVNSLIGRLQTERLSAGSAQAELYPKDIEKYLIPFTEEKIQQEIVASIEESRALKAQSKHLLECAKRAVELAIEQDEQTAMAWLEKETQALR